MIAHARNIYASRTGFTLVELLVAIAVVVIMLLGMAAAMSSVSNLWLSGVGAMDNFTKARVVLGLLDRDIQLMVLRRDLPAFVDGNGNPSCAFYTNVVGTSTTSGYTPDTRTLSYVQYTLNPATTTPTLIRYNYGMDFSTTTPVTPPVGTTGSLALSSNAATDTIFTGIIFFQFQFIDGTGTVLTPPYIPTGSTSATTTPFSYDFTYPGDTSNPRVVVISMLVLSNPAYIVATQNSSVMTKLLSCFTTSAPLTSTCPVYSQAWNSFLNNPDSTFLALPQSVRNGIQVFERHIPLPITTPSL